MTSGSAPKKAAPAKPQKSVKKEPAKQRPEVVPSVLLTAAERRKLRTHKTLAAATSKEQVQAVMQVGERLRLAREMNGWEVSEAARLLGFENAGSLSRFELAKHVSAIPLYVIPRAAQVYGVTTDYLHGLTDDLTLAPALRLRRDVAVWLADEIERGRQRDIDAMLLLQEQIEAVLVGTREVVLSVEELCSSIGYLRDRNVVSFENLPGSNAVLYRAERALNLSTSTAARLSRFKAALRKSGVTPCVPIDPQLPLALGA